MRRAIDVTVVVLAALFTLGVITFSVVWLYNTYSALYVMYLHTPPQEIDERAIGESLAFRKLIFLLVVVPALVYLWYVVYCFIRRGHSHGVAAS